MHISLKARLTISNVTIVHNSRHMKLPDASKYSRLLLKFIRFPTWLFEITYCTYYMKEWECFSSHGEVLEIEDAYINFWFHEQNVMCVCGLIFRILGCFVT